MLPEKNPQNNQQDLFFSTSSYKGGSYREKEDNKYQEKVYVC